MSGKSMRCGSCNCHSLKPARQAKAETSTSPLVINPCCPVAALAEFQKPNYCECGTIFRLLDCHGDCQHQSLRADGVSTILQDRFTGAAIEPEWHTGHSLRAILANNNQGRGLPTHTVRAQTVYASDLSRVSYVRDETTFNDRAAEALF